jgi:hypothetical protein|tara:strand:- start:1280 stop:1462 length:183 start_codon:yes stop_codon:yes gene_type:complete
MEKLSYKEAVRIIEAVVRFARTVSHDEATAAKYFSTDRSNFMMPYTSEEIDEAWRRVQQG